MLSEMIKRKLSDLIWQDCTCDAKLELCFDCLRDIVVAAVAEAVAEERKACVGIAHNHGGHKDMWANKFGREIATAIIRAHGG
jgi:hypothetical protein